MDHSTANMIDPPIVTYYRSLDDGRGAMGYNARNDEIRDNVTRMRSDTKEA